MRVAVVMAGGSGERFWPVSTAARPKQFLKLADPDRTLLEMATERAARIGEPYVATNVRLAEITAAVCVDLKPHQVLAEPHKRNTLGCLIWVAANLIHRHPQDWEKVSLAILTADQKIDPLDNFLACAETALDHAEKEGGIGIIGIEPTRAETGFGYIETHAEPGQIAPVISFREKPKAELAEEYFQSGRFLWNSGMFFLTLPTLVKEIKRQQPDSGQILDEIIDALKAKHQAEAENAFERLTSQSFDTAVMENAETVHAVRSTFEWDDLGSWDAISRSHPLDEVGNAAVGKAWFMDSHNNCVYTDGTHQKVHLLGVEGLVVVATGDTILVCPQDRAQEVKRFLAQP